MSAGDAVSRRRFVGGMTGALSTIGLTPAIARAARPEVASVVPPSQQGTDPYDALAKLAANENPYGPPASVMKAMTDAFKYANRYGYPDGGIVSVIAEHHGVSPANSGSGTSGTTSPAAASVPGAMTAKPTAWASPRSIEDATWLTG